MTKKLTTALVGAMCLLAWSGPAVADEISISKAELQKLGIDVKYARTSISGFSHDGSFITLHQKNPDLKKAGEGYPYELIIVPLTKDGKFGKIRRLPVGPPVTSWEYSMLTPDQKELIIVTRSGATFAKINLETGKMETIAEHVAGKPGFRAHPQVLRMVNDEIFAMGYFYTGDDFADVDCTATFDPTKKGDLAFKRVHDIELMEAKLKPRNYVFTAKDCAFYAVPKGKNHMEMYVWNPPNFEKPTKFDEGADLFSFWGSSGRIAYTMQKPNSLFDLIIYDAKTNKKTVIAADTKDPYLNIFLSEDGSTVLVTDSANRVQRAQFFYADEQTGWKLQPVADLGNRTARFGQVRISEDGKKMAVYSQAGLMVCDVKN